VKPLATILHFGQETAEVQVDHPRPDRLLSAHSPRRETRNFYTHPSGVFSAGEWRCESGRWHIVFAADKAEYFHVLEGRLSIEDEMGRRVEFLPGQGGVIPAGFKGVFTVHESVRKHYVVLELGE